jgi:hypothetical protein
MTIDSQSKESASSLQLMQGDWVDRMQIEISAALYNSSEPDTRLVAWDLLMNRRHYFRIILLERQYIATFILNEI